MSSRFREHAGRLRSRMLAALALVTISTTSAGVSASPRAQSQRALRVCADPANLPYSNRQLQGFENKIAALVARELGAHLTYTWWAQRRGFLRNTLNAGECDVVLGVPAGLELVRSTRPYYRSTFAFVSRADRALSSLRSIDDERLRSLKIGVPLAGDDGANPAPAMALSRRGMASNLVGFPLLAESGRSVPAAVEAVASGALDVAVLWGPVAGAAFKQPGLLVRPLRETRDEQMPFAFSIAMGVRRQDIELARELDVVIARKRTALIAILREYHVPLLSLTPEEASHD
jgi:mxaJ protein